MAFVENITYPTVLDGVLLAIMPSYWGIEADLLY